MLVAARAQVEEKIGVFVGLLIVAFELHAINNKKAMPSLRR